MLYVVAHSCNPKYSKDGDQEGHNLRPAQAKSYRESISTNELGMVVCTCQPSYGWEA
jgi:hypothetical protein